MEKYLNFAECVKVLDDCIIDFKSNNIQQDYTTMFYTLFLNESSNKVKSDIIELVGYKNIPVISNTLEVIWQCTSGLAADPLRCHRGFSIPKKNVITNLEFLKSCLEKEICTHKAEIFELDKKGFINDLIYASKIMQGNSHYFSVVENPRNDYIRDMLEFKGYITKDQSRHGRSGNGTTSGSVDLIVCNTSIQDAIIVEGMNLGQTESKNRTQTEIHYNKLMTEYDTVGNKFNVLLSYATNNDFTNLVLDYKHFIEDYDFEYKALNVNVEKIENIPPTICVLKSSHARNNDTVFVYHVLVQLHK